MQGRRGRFTGFITFAIFLELADKVLVVALAALAVLEVVFLQFGGEALEEFAFGGGCAVLIEVGLERGE